MAVIIGSARSDENKKYSGGKKGDQRQTSTPDYIGEVSLQNFYIHSKGWVIVRPRDKNVAKVMAALMHTACNNKYIGYSQSNRYSILEHGVNSVTPVNCDCSSLVREVIKEATLKDPGDFNTSNEVEKLLETKMFDAIPYYNFITKLYEGDVLVTKTKGHTAIVVFGNTR